MMNKLTFFLLFIIFNTNAQNKFLGIGIVYLKDNSFTIFEDTLNNQSLGEFKNNTNYEFTTNLGYVIDNVDISKYGLISFSSGMVEYDAEKLGLPIITINNNWVKVFCFYDYDKEPVYGWVKTSKINYHLWDKFLINKELFFINDSEIAFYNAFKGNQINVSISKNEYGRLNYIMKPLERKENWLKVKLIFPKNIVVITDNDPFIEVWINYLDEKNFPKVWFYTRGC